METVILRNYRAGDASAVSRLFRKVYGEHYAHHEVYLPMMFNQNHVDRRWHSLLAVHDNQVLGHAALCRETGSHIAEFGLAVVDPDSRGQNIATRLARQLLVHAQALGCRGVTIKQVTQHPYTQRLATTLGFQNTGLLPDYAPSPFGAPAPETVVIGYKPIEGFTLPLPAVTWPDDQKPLRDRLTLSLGARKQISRPPRTAVQFKRCNDRFDLVMARLDDERLAQLRRLPARWLISLRLRLTPGFAADTERLGQIGFHFSGLTPDERGTGWMVLFHRGHQPRTLQLHCPDMQRLHAQIQPNG